MKNHIFEPFNGAIGIAGGMGPDAGIALSANIIYNTIASGDSDHLPQILLSFPSFIPDRTEFILGKTPINPGERIATIIEKLEEAGASVAAIACNSAHAPIIFGRMLEEVSRKKLKIKILSIIDETALFIKRNYPDVKSAGILSTTGTWLTRIYDKLNESSIDTIYLERDEQEMLHNAIYDPGYGIKATAGKADEKVMETISRSAGILLSKGAEVIILGCTELPLVMKGHYYDGVPMINPSTAMARALISHLAPERLKPFDL